MFLTFILLFCSPLTICRKTKWSEFILHFNKIHWCDNKIKVKLKKKIIQKKYSKYLIRNENLKISRHKMIPVTTMII